MPEMIMTSNSYVAVVVCELRALALIAKVELPPARHAVITMVL